MKIYYKKVMMFCGWIKMLKSKRSKTVKSVIVKDERKWIVKKRDAKNQRDESDQRILNIKRLWFLNMVSDFLVWTETTLFW